MAEFKEHTRARRLPPVGACVLCRASGARGGLCAPCAADIAKLRRRASCPQCGAEAGAALVCGECLRNPPHFDATVSFYPYAHPLDILLQRFKYGGGWQLAPAVASYMPPPPACDIILPVPLHPNREQWRGFNQSRELLRAAGIKPRDNNNTTSATITRTTDTPRQSLMPDAKQRRKNVRGAFEVSGVDGKSIVIVDDVMTSGATLNEIARVLKKAGAKKVTNLVVART